MVARLMETVETARADLGDTFTGSVGKKIRPIGRVEHARPLTATTRITRISSACMTATKSDKSALPCPLSNP